MKRWISALFYIICFLVLAAVIYRLGFFIPPEPGESGYVRYCLSVGGVAVTASGLCVGYAAILDWYVRKDIDSYEKKNKDKLDEK